MNEINYLPLRRIEEQIVEQLHERWLVLAQLVVQRLELKNQDPRMQLDVVAVRILPSVVE